MASLHMFPQASVVKHYERHLLQLEVQQFIINGLWPQAKFSVAEYGSYLRYFRWMVALQSWPRNSVNSAKFAIQTYDDLLKIMDCISGNTDRDRAYIMDRLSEDFSNCSKDRILRSVDLTIRLWLFLYMRSEESTLGPDLSDMTEIHWREMHPLSVR